MPEWQRVLQHDALDVNCLTEPVVGLWCSTCLLPSKWRATFAITPKTNPAFVVWRGWYEHCPECKQYAGSNVLPPRDD